MRLSISAPAYQIAYALRAHGGPLRGADWLSDVLIANEVLGPVGRALGTDSADIPATLPPPAYEMGIVAGTRSVHPIGPVAIPGPDDGVVSVDQTRISGVPMVIIPRSHPFIATSRHAADAAKRFLTTGTFEDVGGGPTGRRVETELAA